MWNSSRNHPPGRLQRGSQAKDVHAGSAGKRDTSKEIVLTRRHPTYQPDGSGKRNTPATVESSAACNRAPKRKKRKKKSSRQGKQANPDQGRWIHPRRITPIPEVKETSVVEVNNSYKPLKTEVTEPEEFCLPTPILPEKRKQTRQHSKPKTEGKGRNQPALKVAGKGPS